MEITRLFDILDNYQEIKPNQEVALAHKSDGNWIKYSLADYIKQTNLISAGLLHLGVKKGDTIAVISSNRAEYNIIDMAAMQIGAILVPIYPTISESDYRYILNHAEISYIFLEGEELLRKIEHVVPDVPSLKGIYTFINRGRFQYFEQLLSLGEEYLDMDKINAIKAGITSQDVACMIYTSGTTGNPKGVMLSHSNITMQLKMLQDTPAKWSDIGFSFLPICHAYEKMIVYLYQYLGMSVYYAESLATISENIKEINPTMMTCVPRMLEKIFDKLESAGRKLPYLQQKLYFWAINVAFEYNIEERSAYYNLKHKIADKLIYSKWRKAIGGNFDIVVSGGAAIQKRLASFFSAIGMPVFEGYGLTETSPVIAVSSRKKHGRCAGTVGFPLEGVEIKILPVTNEIVCRGHNVMLGYYKDEQLTKETIDEDGWFHTGDTGKFTPLGQLMITGRLKNIFKTSFGKYVNSFLIEEKFVQSPFIENIVVVGENQKFAAAILIPDFAFLKLWCSKYKIPYTTNEEMVKNELVKTRFKKEVKKYNAFFGDTEQIRKFELVSDEWTQQNGILTPTLKVKRNVIMERYQSIINQLFV